MKKLVGACISILALAACGDDGGNSGPDANTNVADAAPMVDAPETPDAAPNPDAEVADAMPEPDAMCSDDAQCVGRSDGDSLCIGNSVVTCTLDGQGCLAASATACTDPDVCVDGGTPMCVANGDGDSCAAPMYITANTTLTGTDITDDYTDQHDFTDPTCEEGDPTAANVEGIYAVNLAAYQRITVNQTGGLDAVLGIQRVCGDTNACLDSMDDPDVGTDPESVTYFAETSETVYIYVSAYAEVPDPADYSISFAFTQCGDGMLDAGEQCDDGDNDNGDGCSATCQVEWGYLCDNTTPPTVCTALPDLGTHGGGGTITQTIATPVAEDDSHFYTVTFTEPVRVTGTLTAAAGDPDWYAYAETTGLYVEDAVGDETIGSRLERYFTPGKYVIEVYAYTSLTSGYTLTMMPVAPPHTDLGSFAATDAIADVVQATGLAAGASDYYTITFTDDVLLSGSLTRTTTGDMDLYVWEDANPVFNSLSIGDETFADQLLPAGLYYLRPNAYFEDPAVDGYTLSLSTTAAP